MTCTLAAPDEWEREDRDSYRSDAYDDEMAEPRRSDDDIMHGASINDGYEEDEEDGGWEDDE